MEGLSMKNAGFKMMAGNTCALTGTFESIEM